MISAPPDRPWDESPRAEVDRLVRTAVAAGGAYAVEAQDHGFMYGWSFYDPDGHHWEVFWMDPEASPHA
jgi:predicted lactoylglutathione lyase